VWCHEEQKSRARQAPAFFSQRQSRNGSGYRWR
jgi:hypothetical protein